MSLADDPGITPEAHDLARALAHEHILGVLAFMFVCNQADRQGVPAEQMAKTLRDGVLGSLADGRSQMPSDFRALMASHAAKVTDHVVAMCATNDKAREAGLL